MAGGGFAGGASGTAVAAQPPPAAVKAPSMLVPVHLTPASDKAAIQSASVAAGATKAAADNNANNSSSTGKVSPEQSLVRLKQHRLERRLVLACYMKYYKVVDKLLGTNLIDVNCEVQFGDEVHDDDSDWHKAVQADQRDEGFDDDSDPPQGVHTPLTAALTDVHRDGIDKSVGKGGGGHSFLLFLFLLFWLFVRLFASH